MAILFNRDGTLNLSGKEDPRELLEGLWIELKRYRVLRGLSTSASTSLRKDYAKHASRSSSTCFALANALVRLNQPATGAQRSSKLKRNRRQNRSKEPETPPQLSPTMATTVFHIGKLFDKGSRLQPLKMIDLVSDLMECNSAQTHSKTIRIEGESVSNELIRELTDQLERVRAVSIRRAQRIQQLKDAHKEAMREARCYYVYEDMSVDEAIDCAFDSAEDFYQWRLNEPLPTLRQSNAPVTNTQSVQKSLSGAKDEPPQFDDEVEIVSWRGETFPLTDRQYAIVKRIVTARGGYVSGTELKVYSDRYERPDNIIQRLPPTLRRHIKSKKGRGYRWVGS